LKPRAHPIRRSPDPQIDHPITGSPDHRIRLELLRWSRKLDRDLPWRNTKDPYRIWVSEVMLQQTTVAAVLGRYERFLRRFPDVGSLARSRKESVLAEWSGLGYYARARNLHLAARRIMKDHGGRLPADPEELEALPGFGAYMAAAVACLAFDRRVPAAEANVKRILSRVFALRPDGARGERRLLEHARNLLPRRRPGDGIAALMDLGQLVCTPRRPRCADCPLVSDCAAFSLGRPEAFPRRPIRPPATQVHVAAALAWRDGRVLLERRRSGYLAGLWAFPAAEASSAGAARRALAAELANRSMRLAPGGPIGRTRHTIMRRRMHIQVFRASAGTLRSKGLESCWLAPAELERAATPTLTRKIARAAGFAAGSSGA
jgi:A/G-specific adenine glycosylase